MASLWILTEKNLTDPNDLFCFSSLNSFLSSFFPPLHSDWIFSPGLFIKRSHRTSWLEKITSFVMVIFPPCSLLSLFFSYTNCLLSFYRSENWKEVMKHEGEVVAWRSGRGGGVRIGGSLVLWTWRRSGGRTEKDVREVLWTTKWIFIGAWDDSVVSEFRAEECEMEKR